MYALYRFLRACMILCGSVVVAKGLWIQLSFNLMDRQQVVSHFCMLYLELPYRVSMLIRRWWPHTLLGYWKPWIQTSNIDREEGHVPTWISTVVLGFELNFLDIVTWLSIVSYPWVCTPLLPCICAYFLLVIYVKEYFF